MNHYEFNLRESTEGPLPMFGLRKVEWEKRLAKKAKPRIIQKISINSNCLLIGLSNGVIIRWKLNDSTKDPEEIELNTKPEDVIEQIFVDCSGHHSLIGMKSGETFYLHSKMLKPKKLSKLQGLIESAAFDKYNSSDATTKSILVGTSSGAIYEIILDNTGKEKYFQQIYQLSPPMAINAIYYEPINTSGEGLTMSGNAEKYYVLFSTDSPTRLYHIVGGPSLHQLFSELTNDPPFIELPGEVARAELICYSKTQSPKSDFFALLTGAGIYHGSLKEIRSGSDNVLSEAHILPLVEPVTKNPNFPVDIENTFSRILSFSPTAFHFMTLRGDRLQFLSNLNGDLVQEELLKADNGLPINLARDCTRNLNYLFTTTSIFQVTANEEDRDVWSTFLVKALATGDDALFDLAYDHSKTKERKDAVTKARAEFYFKEQKYDKAALYFAHSGQNFEEIVLRLLSVNENLSILHHSSTMTNRNYLDIKEIYDTKSLLMSGNINLNPIRIFLLELLKILPVNLKSQRTMLCTWLSEIFLHQITESNLSMISTGPDLTNEFMTFLKANKNSLDFATILHLLVGRNNRSLLLFYAKVMGDYHRVIYMLLTDKKYIDALAVVENAPFEKISNFIYKITPILFEMIPEKTINVLLSKSQFQIADLLPSILRYISKYDEEKNKKVDSTNFALVYLEEYLKKTGLNFSNCHDDVGISFNSFVMNLGEIPEENQNILVEQWMKSETEAIAIHIMGHVYAKYDKQEKRLCSYLHTLLNLQELGLLLEIIDVDLEYILRQCRIYQRKRGSVYALILLGNFKQAVEEALVFDIELAKSIVRRHPDFQHRKDMWLQIGKYILSNDEVRKAVLLVKESNDDIRIEDLLPFLPDFTEIDSFKEDICKSLSSCSARINDVKSDMQHLLDTAETTLLELESMKTRGYSTVSSHERCSLCDENLAGNQFYLFPCSHGFHSVCLVKESYKNLPPNQLSALKSLEESLKIISARVKDSDSRARTQQEALQQELDGYIGADCPLCGYAMIALIGKSLISDEERANEAIRWTL